MDKKCVFYRKLENPVMGPSVGYCDLGGLWVICDGEIKYCEEPDGFIKNFYETWKRNKEKTSKRSSWSEKTL